MSNDRTGHPIGRRALTVLIGGVVVWLALAGVVCGAGAAPVRDLMPADEAIARARAVDATGDHAAAREAWERVIDSSFLTGEQMQQATARLHALNELVPPNSDPAKANVWTAKVFIFRTFDFTWSPKGSGEENHVHIETSDDEMEVIKDGFARFAELVFEYSRGELRLDYEVKVIEEPLTRMSGDGSFWLGPWDVEDLIDGGYDPGTLDSVFAYVKLSDGKDQKVPASMFGGTFGGDIGPGGAGWTGIMWYPGWLKGDGEVELHEWLHQVDWGFARRLRYTDQIVPSSDGGRKEGEEGGDPCYRRQPDEPNWLRFYRHLMSEHITSRMWQEARCRPWEGVEYARDWLIFGPFGYEGGPAVAFEEQQWDPSRVPTDGETVNGLTWQRLTGDDDYLDLNEAFGKADHAAAYALARVESDREQEVALWLGYDDSVVAWVNGEEVFRFIGPRAAHRDDASTRVHLGKGPNAVLLKVADIAGGWGCYARFGDEIGRAADGVRWMDFGN